MWFLFKTTASNDGGNGDEKQPGGVAKVDSALSAEKEGRIVRCGDKNRDIGFSRL